MVVASPPTRSALFAPAAGSNRRAYAQTGRNSHLAAPGHFGTQASRRKISPKAPRSKFAGLPNGK